MSQGEPLLSIKINNYCAAPFLFQIFEAKRSYNDKLIELRDYKIEMINKVNTLTEPTLLCAYTNLYACTHNAH